MQSLFRWTVLPLLAVVLVLTGCDDAVVAPDVASDAADADASAPKASIDAAFLDIARDLDGFGGFYYDEDGTLNVYLTSAAKSQTALPQVKSVLESHLGDLSALAQDPRRPRAKAGAIRVHTGEFSFPELDAYRTKSFAAFDIPGVHTIDVDERTNRIRVDVEDAAAMMQASGVLANAGVPEAAVVFEEKPRPVRTATLRDKIRPVEGGLQIAFDSNLCTYGFTAIRNGVRGFVTNAHCSTSMFTVTPTYYYQPSRTSGNYIGYEYADPALRNGSYRYSDAAFVRITSSVSSRLGDIARTTGWSYQTGSGSLTIDSSRPHIEIDTEQTTISTGNPLDKIGRTTGWTYGPVESTCQTVNMGTYTLYCQDEVYAGVNGGDSGSPVFRWKGDTDGDGLDNANLVGLLWGGRTYPSGKKTFLFSRINYVEVDLGSLNTY